MFIITLFHFVYLIVLSIWVILILFTFTFNLELFLNLTATCSLEKFRKYQIRKMINNVKVSESKSPAIENKNNLKVREAFKKKITTNHMENSIS